MGQGTIARDAWSPRAFGFCVEQTPQGLRYRSTAPSVDDTLEQLRRAGLLDEDQ
jgi:hypothetical protein